jgi:predicted phosphoribosyltransferase
MFHNRIDAGQRLAAALQHLAGKDVVVLALPRGGVPVAAQVAKSLAAPLDLLIVRKLGVPMQPELAMGAVADGDPPVVVRNESVIQMIRVSEAEFGAVLARETAEARRRRERYLGARPRVALADRTIVVIDDGIATGSTMQAALRALRHGRPQRIVVAVPVAAADTLEMLRSEADEVVCLQPELTFGAIGASYEDFRQVSDEEVIDALDAMPDASSA